MGSKPGALVPCSDWYAALVHSVVVLQQHAMRVMCVDSAIHTRMEAIWPGLT